MAAIVFWASLALVVYVCVGYPLLIHTWSNIKRQPARGAGDGPATPELFSVAALIPTYNEEPWIRQKIENTLAMHCRRERMEVLGTSGPVPPAAASAHWFHAGSVIASLGEETSAWLHWVHPLPGSWIDELFMRPGMTPAAEPARW